MPEIIDRPSPNCGPRRDGLRPELIVLHYTEMHSAQAAIDRLCDPRAEVSAHYVIAAGGAVTRLVDEDRRAWHAGQGSWQGRGDVNSRSIGIELDNRGNRPFPDPLMRSLEDLLSGIMARHGIAADGVIGHSDMAPGRKIDPGPRFDWARLARQGLARSPVEATADDLSRETFLARARAAGYTADVPFETLLHATRLRFRPWRDGPLGRADLAL